MSTTDGGDDSGKIPKLSRSSSGAGPDSSQDASFNAKNNALLGRKLGGRFTLKAIVGQGRAATVFLAEDDELGEKMAIKILRDLEPKNIERFRREAKLTRKLNHPNVISVFEYGYEDDFIFIVMEYLKGRSLATIIKKEHSLELNRAINLVTQAARGLSHAHKKGVIHRDVTPSNILVATTDDGTEMLKVLDFGLSKLLIDVDGEKNLTTTGHVVGSPPYMSVEQINGQELDARSDIYSLGCVLYECLTGVPPFSGATDVATLMMHLSETPPSLSDASGGKDFPVQVSQLVKKMLARQAEDRYANMEALLADLDKFRGAPVASKVNKVEEKVDPTSTKLVFICHAEQDKEKALALCNTLETQTPLKCWISARDIPPGANYPREVMRGLKTSSAMILVYSQSANTAKHILREFQEAERLDLPILCFPLDNSEMSDDLRYLLGVSKKFSIGVTDQELAQTVMAAVGTTLDEKQTQNLFADSPDRPSDNRKKTDKDDDKATTPGPAVPKSLMVSCAILAIGAIAAIVLYLTSSHSSNPDESTRAVRSITVDRDTSEQRKTSSLGKKLGDCYALFLAVQDYQDPKIKDLKAPISDAEAMATELEKYYGWKVEVVPNPDMETIYLKLEQYASRKYKEDDQLFVSVGAHGDWVAATEEGFVLARDAEKNDPSFSHGFVPFSRLKDILTKGNCKHTLLALDVCYAGAFFNTIATGTRADDDVDETMPLEDVLGQKLQIRTRKVLTSGERTPVYDVGASGHSPFVTRFLTVLRSYGGKDHFLRFADFAKPIVGTKPGGMADGFDTDQPGSDFIFIPKSSAEQAAKESN